MNARILRGRVGGAAVVSLLLVGACKDNSATSSGSSATTSASSAPSAAASVSVATSATSAPSAKSSATPAASGSGSDGAQAGPLTADSFCTSVFGTVIADSTKGCSDDDKKRDLYKLITDFADDPITECKSTIVAGVTGKRLSFDATAAAACVKAAQSANKSGGAGEIVVPDLDEVDACKAIVSGLQDESAVCHSSLECKQGLTCIGVKGPDFGKCQKLPSKAGDACDAVFLKLHDLGHRARCATGLACDPLDSVCRAAVAANGACRDSAQCAAGLQCHAGKCDNNPPAVEGGACDDDTDDCAKGFFCKEGAGTTAGTCAAKKAAGAKCASPEECKGECRIDDGKSDGTCASFCGSG
jgi:hypothetical protein